MISYMVVCVLTRNDESSESFLSNVNYLNIPTHSVINFSFSNVSFDIRSKPLFLLSLLCLNSLKPLISIIPSISDIPDFLFLSVILGGDDLEDRKKLLIENGDCIMALPGMWIVVSVVRVLQVKVSIVVSVVRVLRYLHVLHV